MRHIALILSIAIAGASAPVFAAGDYALAEARMRAAIEAARRAGAASAGSAKSSARSVSGSSSSKSSVFDAPERGSNIRHYAQSSSVSVYVPSRGPRLVLTASYDKSLVCSKSVFSDDCLSAQRPAVGDGLKVLRSR